MNILRITKYPPIEGGAASRAFWLTLGLAKRGHRNFVVSNAYEVEECWREKIPTEEYYKLHPKNVNLYFTQRLPYTRIPIPYYYMYCEKLLSLSISIMENEDIDIIDCHYFFPYGFCGVFLKKLVEKKVPLVLQLAGSDITTFPFRKVLMFTYSKCIKEADGIVVTSEIHKKVLLKFGIKEEKVISIPITIDLDVFSPHGPSIILVPEEDIPVFLIYGKLYRGKGVPSVIKVASLLEYDFLLVIVGDGPDKQKCITYAKELGLDNKVKFLPFQPPWRIPELIRGATCVIVPQKGFAVRTHTPTVIKEAMGCARPVIISSEIFGAKKLVINEKYGFVYNPTNEKELLDAMEYIINNPKEAKKMGVKARKNIESFNDFQRYLSKIEDFYRNVG